MSRLAWSVARLPVSLMVAGVRQSRVLPVAAGERPPRLPTPAMIERGLAALERAADSGSRRLDDPDGRWRELGNKVRAFAWFRRAAEPGDGLGIFADLWRREGRGYLLGRSAAAGRAEPGSESWPEPARRDLLPCHTGLGLGLASHHLEGLGNRSAHRPLREAVDRFLADARRLSLAGFEGAVIEALGLTVQLSHPGLLRRVDEDLAARPPRLRALFWHGVGRGLYFDPREMAPRVGGGWRAARRALAMPPGDETRRNAVAGLAWAAALVNFCEPQIVAARLREPPLGAAGDAAAAAAGDAASNGVASVTLLWLNAVGDGPLLSAFREFWAAPGNAPWQRRIGATVESAIAGVYPLLVEPTRIDELFRYRPVDGWAESLDKTAGVAAPGREVPLHG